MQYSVLIISPLDVEQVDNGTHVVFIIFRYIGIIPTNYLRAWDAHLSKHIQPWKDNPI